MHITNASTTDTATVTYIRMQTIDPAGGTALPSAVNYYQIGTGQSYSSGGTAKTPVNMAVGSTVTSGVTAYDANPTLSGTLNVFDREYVKAEAEVSRYGKEGALVLLPGESMTIQFVGDHTSGTAYARVFLLHGT